MTFEFEPIDGMLLMSKLSKLFVTTISTGRSRRTYAEFESVFNRRLTGSAECTETTRFGEMKFVLRRSGRIQGMKSGSEFV